MTILTQTTLDYMIDLILKSVDSPNTLRAYHRAMLDFREWFSQQGSDFTKSTIQNYVLWLRESGKFAGNINLHLIAIRRLAAELADSGLMDPAIAAGIIRVRNVRAEGQRLGNWMTLAQAQSLLNIPQPISARGKRDRAILAVLLSCGLRREEATSLTFEHIQQRDGRWVIVDLIGKRNSLRSIPMPEWCKAAIDQWAEALGAKSGIIFRRIRQGGRICEGLTPQAIYLIVLQYSKPMGIDLAPHDCRRTFAKLAHKGGSPIEQIKYSLGHSSVVTTERYLGACQTLVDAPCDHLGLFLG